MSKLRCICGHTIVDQSGSIPYKGHILPDTQVENISSALTDSIDSLSDAIKANKRLDWIKENFHVPPYPTDLNDFSMIYDLVSTKLVHSTQDIFECEACGRIAIEVGQTNHFKFFKPETDDTKGILNGNTAAYPDQDIT